MSEFGNDDKKLERPSRTTSGPGNRLGTGRTSPVAQLQRRLGNAQLLQLRARRAAVQRQAEGQMTMADATAWVEQQERERMKTRAAEDEFLAQEGEQVNVPSGGKALPDGLAQHAEDHLGVSMRDVQVVTNGSQATDPIQAQAFTAHDGGTPKVVLANDVDLQSQDGQFTLMHELAHVAQQKRGQAEQLDGLGGDSGVRDSLENHADQQAEEMLRKA